MSHRSQRLLVADVADHRSQRLRSQLFFATKKPSQKKNTYTPIYDLKETRDLELKWLKIQEWVRTSAGMTNNNNHQQGFGSFS